ncbi:MAG: S9 family peptidase [Kibdelosporangium sp.]
MRPEDIQLLTVPDSVALRGSLLLVAAAHPDLETNSYRGGLLRVALDGSGTTPWTYGHRDTEPAISPDGNWVAFLRTGEPGGKAQLYLAPADGGEPRALTDLPLGVRTPVWSPDSRRIAFTARIPAAGRYSPDVPARSESPRWITRMDYRIDDVGFLADRRTRLFVVELDAEPVELTDGKYDVGTPSWTPDGSDLVFAAARDFDKTETLHNDLYSIPATGGTPALLVKTAGDASCPVVGDGVVVFLSPEFDGVSNFVARNTGLWSAPLQAGAVARRLTDLETVDCEPIKPVITPTGVLVCVRNRGAVELRSVPFDSVPFDAAGAPLSEMTLSETTLSETTLLAGASARIKGFAVDGSVVAAVVSTPDSSGEVVLCGGGGARLTEFAAALPAMLPMKEITGRSPDGYEPHGWVVLPSGDGPHPVLLAVHGGPFMYHGWGFFDEAQVYAAAGYAVVLPNPRGSAGYGQAHGQSIVGAMATVDVDDVLAVLDAALELPECDGSRVGVMGGSYGGFMTGWLAAHHGSRFRAAWSERAVTAWDSFAGSSDIGWVFADAYVSSDPDVQRKLSPLTYANQIEIPFAVVHSEEDWRCPLEQAQRMFVALKRNGTPTEFLLFPGEGHELTRSGQPRHRKERFDAVLSWWSRHL